MIIPGIYAASGGGVRASPLITNEWTYLAHQPRRIICVVPAGVEVIHFKMWGAAGATGSGRSGTSGLGGAGGYVNLYLPVNEGDLIGFEVGGAPSVVSSENPIIASRGGWPDGGNGGRPTTLTRLAGGGGGSSRLYLNGVLVAVAAGGGGSGSTYVNNQGNQAGAGSSVNVTALPNRNDTTEAVGAGINSPLPTTYVFAAATAVPGSQGGPLQGGHGHGPVVTTVSSYAGAGGGGGFIGGSAGMALGSGHAYAGGGGFTYVTNYRYTTSAPFEMGMMRSTYTSTAMYTADAQYPGAPIGSGGATPTTPSGDGAIVYYAASYEESRPPVFLNKYSLVRVRKQTVAPVWNNKQSTIIAYRRVIEPARLNKISTFLLRRP